jgi:DNA-binding NarL/FixJ family response regulator/two-component sensor histidine kinase
LLNAIHSQLTRQSQQNLEAIRQLALHLIELQETERRTLAETFVEELLQLMSALRMQLSVSGGSLPGEVSQIMDTLIDRANGISMELFPTMLEHLGLCPALKWLCTQFTQQTGIEVMIDCHDIKLNADIKLLMYRLVQEALRNIAKHAHTEAAEVRVWLDEGSLQLLVEDQGVGFSMENLVWTSDMNGLLLMRERAASIGGEMSIRSAPEEGTSLEVRLPLEHHQQPLKAPQLPLSQAPHASPPQKSAEDQISILLADKHEITRQGLRVLLDSQPEFTVVGQVEDGHDVPQLVKDLRPDILVIDLMMTGLSGLDAAQKIAESDLPTKVIILSTQTAEVYITEALRCGAWGYVVKDASAEDLVQAVQQVHDGRRYLSPVLMDRAIYKYASDTHPDDQPGDLTRREMEVLRLLVAGLRNAEIADKLTISRRTVETHRANIMQKLGLRTQADLVRYALQCGLVALDD